MHPDNGTIMLTDEELESLKETFYAQALEMTEELTAAILSLDGNACAGEPVKRIKRYFHTLKGDSSSIGLKAVSELIHSAEDIMAALEGKSIALDGEVSEALLKSVDEIEKAISADRAGTPHEIAPALKESISRILGGVRKAPLASLTEYEELLLSTGAAEGRRLYRLTLEFSADCQMKSAAAMLLMQYLSGELDFIRVSPSPEDPAIESARFLECVAATLRTPEELRERCVIPGVTCNPVFEEIEAPAAPPAEGSREGEKRGGPQDKGQIPAPATIRVMSERVDQIMDLVGELVMGRSMMEELVGRLETKYPKDELVHSFLKTKSFITRSLSDLQRSVMSIRMVPVEKVFRRFPRMVRDLGNSSAKEVRLVLRGERTEIDKALVDIIGEPLLHIIRNAVDHGIETPEERKKAGKSQEGTITVEACHRDSDIVIRVADDGKGINTGRLLEKAVESGLLGAEQAASMSVSELMGLIFLPGFSTAAKLSAVSGRGIGMDIVKEAVEGMRGSITVSSTPGSGTEFTLRFPLTLSIMRAVLVRSGGNLYALPLTSVVDIKRAKPAEVDSITGMDVLRVRDGVLPLAAIDGRRATIKNSSRRSRVFVLVINHGGRKVGLAVDSLAGEEELVVKSVDEKMVTTPLVSGASILGNGKVVLILNVGELVSRALAGPEAAWCGRADNAPTGTNG